MRAPLLFIAALCAAPAWAGDLTASVDLSPQWLSTNSSSPYAVPPVQAGEKALRQELALRWQDGGFNAQASLRLLAESGQSLGHAGEFNQLYYDGDVSNGIGWTVGKKLMPWGVGFGFRPLDVVQRENRRGVNAPPLSGIPVLEVDRLSADDAFSLVWQQPGGGRGDYAYQDQALALHWYRMTGAGDMHAVARYSDRLGVEAGAGFSMAVGDEWAFHGALLDQQRYSVTLNSLTQSNSAVLAAASPMQEQQRRHALKAVAGMQWTGASGLGLLCEAWYDGQALSQQDWQGLNALTQRQRALSGHAPQAAIEGNLAWSATTFNAPNLMRENLLLRASYDVEQRWKTAFEWLQTPRDGGHAITLSAGYEGDRQRIGIGMRWLGGRADSALAQAPVQRTAWLDWRISLQ
jgi:hypothetical protein